MTGIDMALIAALGAAGALVRWAVTSWVTNWNRALMVVLVNTLGAFGAGLTWSADWGAWATLLAGGLWGSLTTLSTLAVDVVETSRRHTRRRALVLLALHVIAGLVAVWLGVSLGGVIAGS